jgi:hypothetical protein
VTKKEMQKEINALRKRVVTLRLSRDLWRDKCRDQKPQRDVLKRWVRTQQDRLDRKARDINESIDRTVAIRLVTDRVDRGIAEARIKSDFRRMMGPVV